MRIVEYSDQYKQQTINFILDILKNEFGLGHIERPDLYNIPEVYQKNKSNFWLAIENDKVIGTVAFVNYGRDRGYLKRMYIDKNYRGKGVASQLVDTLIEFAKENKYKEIFLATIEEMIAANKFYAKVGFERIEKLPDDIPALGDTIFYRINLLY